jgi:hypothetical protein
MTAGDVESLYPFLYTDRVNLDAVGGRLLAFGNGGSSTDAQEVVSLFPSPGHGARPLPAFGLTNDKRTRPRRGVMLQ